jgi:hypothetical protein
MHKPRINFDIKNPFRRTTMMKHFGTIMSNPWRYYQYKKSKDQFAATNSLNMHNHYTGELTAPVHPYPGANGGTTREQGVIYTRGDHGQPYIAPNNNLMNANVHDHQGNSGVANDMKGDYRGDLVVLRSEVQGAPPENKWGQIHIKRSV